MQKTVLQCNFCKICKKIHFHRSYGATTITSIIFATKRKIRAVAAVAVSSHGIPQKRIAMKHQQIYVCIVVTLLVLQLTHAAPLPEHDIGLGDMHSPVDYNQVVGHFKDFFMYLPVMMTTLKETMSGFPKFAEGIRILTSKTGRLEGPDCDCEKNSNEIDSNFR